MSAEGFVGHNCPRCGTTIGFAAQAGGGPMQCPGCGGPMQAAPGGPEVHVLANVECKHCHTRIGMLSVVGGDAECPSCGKPLP